MNDLVLFLLGVVLGWVLSRYVDFTNIKQDIKKINNGRR